MTTYLFIIFSFGLIVGSFANVCIYRWPRNGSVQKPVRSRCPWCEQMLSWYENIPVVSFLFLQSHCRHCHSPISWRYPLVELSMGALWAASYYFFRPQSPIEWLFLVLQLYLMFVVVVTTLIDLDWRIIPDLCTMPLLALGVIFSLANPSLGEVPIERILQCFAGVLIGGGVPWLMSMIARIIAGKDGVGWGDIKLLAAYGSLFGWKFSVGVYVLACFLGGIPAIVGLLTGKLKRHHYIPFGPFLNLALLIIIFGHHLDFWPVIVNFIYQIPVEN